MKKLKPYKRLDFGQYYIDTSVDYAKTGKATRDIKYSHIKYWDGIIRHSAEYDVYFDEERNVIQLNFEETNGLFDWFSNFDYPQKYYDEFKFEDKVIQLRVHRGWAKMYKAMKHQVRDAFKAIYDEHPNAYVEIVGWSLGSGMAQLCAQDLFYNFAVKSYLYTYGSVKPFYGVETHDYLLKCCHAVYNFAVNNDIVTYMPPFKNWFCLKRVDIKTNEFKWYRLFNPLKYHTIYSNSELYTDIK